MQIPVFVKTRDKEYIDSLNEKMQVKVKEQPEIVISELEIIGSDEIFNHNDDEYVIKFKGKSKQVTSLTAEELKDFCAEYAERVFNILRSNDGFQNFDRENTVIGDANIEAMDLYKEGHAFAIKIGNSSGKLCYAIDQSLTALKLYKQGELTDIPQITTIALWFVLERKNILKMQMESLI